MILQGRNLIISADGEVIAGAKSCEINVQCDIIETASPNSGNWKQFLVGRKTWSVSTNHLIKNLTWSNGIFKAYSHPWLGSEQSYISYNGTKTQIDAGSGLTMVVYQAAANDAYTFVSKTKYDTMTDGTSAMITAINSLSTSGNDYIVGIISSDAFLIDANLRIVLKNKLHIPEKAIPVMTTWSHGAFTAIGGTTLSGNGIACYEQGRTGEAHCSLRMNQSMIPIQDAPIKKFLMKAGNAVTLRLQVDGFSNDAMSGTAIITSVKTTATLGNLIQGSYSFKGSGPLE